MSNVEEDFIKILDCFSGADGGVSFVHIKTLLDSLKEDEKPAARKIEKIVTDMANLIRVAENG